MIELRRLIPEDLPRLRQFWKDRWCDEFVVGHSVVYYPDGLDGFVAMDGEEWVGLITYLFSGAECEIVSIDSTREGQGIGTKLMDAAVAEARQQPNCKRVFLVTTNDNLNALAFYQKRGFEMVKVNRGAVNESRKIKPSIPVIGMHNIALRDEIEMEIPLKQ
jgi:GNAT superfamily N-acetyltransferase